MPKPQHKAWIVSVDMGYGHQRAAAALEHLAEGDAVISANSYGNIPESDRRIWSGTERFYDFVSRLKSHGWLGRMAFNLFDNFQRIEEFYPLRQSHNPTFQLREMFAEIESGHGQHLVRELSQKHIPLITPFPAIGFMAERWGYPAPIHIITTDADISRAWAPLHPDQSIVHYCTATQRDSERLEEYGVPSRHITYTGFPLPRELVGTKSLIAKRNLAARLPRLDPSGEYRKKFAPLVRANLGRIPSVSKNVDLPPLRLTFAVGGAGAQVEIGIRALESLTSRIRENKIVLNLVAGVSKEVAESFRAAVAKLALNEELGRGVNILCSPSKEEYFKAFNALLAETDVLWTKPSELSFFSALGLPILIAPPIGSQEIQNRKWLNYLDAGTDALDPSDTHEWLPDLLRSGRLAELALNGFLKGEREGVHNITEAVFGPHPK